MRRSRVLEKIRSGKVATSVNLSWGFSPRIVEMAGMIGYDSVWIDNEHRPYDDRDLAHLILAARCGDIDALVRVRREEGYTAISRPLEEGAAGVICPRVDTPEQAARIVANAKFHPQGLRAMENVSPDADFGFADTLEYMAHANRETALIVQIETASALENVEAIAAVPGVDILFFGPGDMSQALGKPQQFDRSGLYLEDVARRIAAAAERAGIAWGCTVGTPEATRPFIDLGARWINVGGDYGMLRQALEANHAALRQILD